MKAYISFIGEHVSSSFISKNSDLKMNLWDPDRVGDGTIKIKALIMVCTTVNGIRDMALILGLHIDSIPTCWKLDVEFQL